VKANGMGDVDPARFARAVKDVSEAFGLPAAPAPDKVFSNKYPAAQGGPHGRAVKAVLAGLDPAMAFVEISRASASPTASARKVSLAYGSGPTRIADARRSASTRASSSPSSVPSGCGKSTIMKLVTGLCRRRAARSRVARQAGHRPDQGRRHGVPERRP
jgi:hypothetical protein